ncbi:WASH complex subunit 2-like [Culicoides brevitarsis]|uniref:WASH complex subunit 2-like n=1 Tax=Culicoides brevitarsis TaxID=469753 RepID=UPI00307C83F1
METRSKARNQHKSLIEKLPVEMLLEIFEYLDSWSIRRCSEVCITFFHLTLRPEFKDFFELTMSDDYLAPNCGIGKIFASGKRTKRTFDHLTLKSVTFETLVFAMIFFTQLGPEVRKVYIDASFFRPIIYKTGTYMTERVFRGNILINFPNLEELRVDAAQTLDKIIFFPPSLKIISVDLAKFGGNVKDYKKFLTDNMGLARLEKLNFIKMMKMHNFDQNNIIIYQHSKISEAVASIIQEIGQYWKIRINCNLLEHSVIEPNCITGLYTENLTQISYNSLLKFPNLKDLSLDLDTSVHCFGSHQLNSDLSHVESLWIAPGRGTKCESCILQMISSFSGLTKLTYHGNLTEHQIRLIFDQLQNLEYLELVGRIPKNILDSSKFTPNSIEQLKNLQALFIVHVSSTLETGISNDCLLKFASLPNLKVLHNLFSPQSDAFFTPNTTTGSSTTPVTPVYRSFIDDLPPEDDYTVPATFDDFDYNQEDNENFEESNAKTATDPFLFNDEPPELTENVKIDEDKVDNSKEIKSESFKNKFKMFEPAKVDAATEVPKEKKEISKPAPKKLNVNLNINVSALLPGAKRPSPKKPEEEDDVKIEEKPQKTPDPVPNISKPAESEPVVATPARYITTEAQESSNLLVSLNKNRVKAPNTRKPSTRKARVQSYHESTVKGESINVLATNTEVKGKEPPLSVAEMLRTEKLKDQLSRRSLNFDEVDEFKVPLKKDLKPEVAEVVPKPEILTTSEQKAIEKEVSKPVEATKVEKSVKTAAAEPKKVQKETQPKSKVSEKVVQDDPLKIVEPKTVEKVEKIVEKKPPVNVVAPQTVEKSVKIDQKLPEKVVEPVKAPKLEKSSPNRKPLLFDDDDDDEDDPFSIVSRPKTKVAEPPKPVEPAVKPKEKSKSSVFASDSDDDDLFSTIKPKSAPKKEEKPPTEPKKEQKTTKLPKLFDDSDDEDDLFSGKTSKKKEIVTSTATKSSNISKPDPKPVQSKSIFGSDDDGDDLFSKVSVPKKKSSVTKPSDSLFGDDSDDDSLFGAASSKGKSKSSNKVESGTKTGAVKKTTSVVQNDPLADLLK